jgi:hypothetical protein
VNVLEWLVAGTFVPLGLGLLVWALVGDRPRGRRRCGRCWYDMGGVEGLRCPECGRAARAERALGRTRRRWRMAALAVALVGLGLSPRAVPWVERGGWVPLAPAWVLRLAAPTLDEPSDAYIGQIAAGTAPAPDVQTAWQRLLVGRHVQRQLRVEVDALRATGKSAARFQQPLAGYVWSTGSAWRLFSRELGEALVETERLCEAGKAPNAGWHGPGQWLRLCRNIGPAAGAHAPRILSIALDEGQPRLLRHEAVDAVAELGHRPSLRALLEARLDPLGRSRILASSLRHGALAPEEAGRLFAQSALEEPGGAATLFVHEVRRLLRTRELEGHPALLEALRRISEEHADADVRRSAMWP